MPRNNLKPVVRGELVHSTGTHTIAERLRRQTRAIRSFVPELPEDDPNFRSMRALMQGNRGVL